MPGRPGAPDGAWGLTSAVPGEAGAADAVVCGQIGAALEALWAVPVGTPTLVHACPTCGSRDHGTPRLRGLPPGRVALVSFTHVADDAATPRRLGAWWAPGGEAPAGQERGLGVDLERVDAPAFATAAALGALVFSPAERAWIAARPRAGRPAARARLWTRKEAIVKAAGTGFRTDPSAVDALVPPPGMPVRDLGPHDLGPHGHGVPTGAVGALAWRERPAASGRG